MNADWVMVIITAVYVAATIAIWRSNKKALKINERQLNESKQQFAETQRLSVLPFLSGSIGEPVYRNNKLPLPDMYLKIGSPKNENSVAWINSGIRIKNIGSGLICKLSSKWCIDGESEDKKVSSTLLCQGGEMIINVSITGEYQDKEIAKKAELIFCFEDVLANRYEQAIEIHLQLHPHNQHMSIVQSEMKEPRLIKKAEGFSYATFR